MDSQSERDDAERTCFFEKWRRHMREIASHSLGPHIRPRADTSDIVQEGMLQFWQDLNSRPHRSEGEYRAWVRSIASGQTSKIVSHNTALKRSVQCEVAAVQDVQTSAMDPAETVEQSEQFARLAAAIQALDPNSQRIVYDYFFEKKSFNQIARELDSDRHTVMRRCQRALNQLRRTL